MRVRHTAWITFAVVAGGCGVGARSGAHAVAGSCPASDRAALVTPNDQTVPAGAIAGDTLDLGLDIRRAVMEPEGEQGPRLDVVTFGETGSAPAVPGPLVRAPAGTTVRVRVCNALADTVWIVGLAANGEIIVAAPRVVSVAAFTLDAPGIRAYRGMTREDTVMRPFGPTATLAGAVITDGEERWGDRVLVISDWAPSATGDLFALQVNGLSWPHTERLRYAIGDTARWIVVNASPVEHPMHLHGFHFLITARSRAAGDSIYDADHRRLAVTEILMPSESMALEWVPERGGRWLFHCHIASHMHEQQRLNMLGIEAPEVRAMHVEDHAQRAMAGLVVGIEVTGDPAVGLAAGEPSRRERLLVQERADVYPNGEAGFGFVLQRGPEPAADSIAVPGLPIVLTRGELSEINVVNRLTVPTAVHWHGLEIESYFDGVPGWSGDERRTTPLIAPGDSFLVRIAPPRAGTYIYHSHADELRQLGSGLFGAVIVLEPGETFDPRTDHVLVFSMAGPDLDIAPIVANNGADPALVLEAGLEHRIRIINITAEDLVRMEIHDADGPVSWRIVAIDGADVPAGHGGEHPASLVTGPGETVDVMLRPGSGDLRLIAESFNNFEAVIRVRP